MVVVPQRLTPGATGGIEFPRHDPRTPGFTLERRIDTAWVFEWVVTSDPDTEPVVFSAAEYREREMVWNSGPGFDGSEVHQLPVPAGAPPGDYRVCTAITDPILCAEFEVTTS